MQSMRRASVRVLSALLALAVVAGCGDDDPVAPDTLAGTYTATTFQVTLGDNEPIDVLSHGGSLKITLHGDDSVTGTLYIPASLGAGETATTTSMNGTAIVSGGTVQLDQEADTFVRDLRWSVGTNTLSVTNQRLGEAVLTITLTRQ